MAQANAAWFAKKAEIDEWLARREPRSRVAYLRSAHASGKSTTFLKYLIDSSLAGPDDGRFYIYVAPHRAELNLVTEYLNENLSPGTIPHVSLNFGDPGPEWHLTTYDNYHSWDMERGATDYPERVTIVADVELRSSVSAELFFASLLNRLRWTPEDPLVVADIILTSPHRCERTISAFLRLVGDVSEFEIPVTNPKLTVEVVDDADFEKVVGDAAAACLEEGNDEDGPRAVVIARETGFLWDALADKEAFLITPRDVGNMKGSSLHNRAIAVHSEANLSARVRNLRVLALNHLSRSATLDTATGQIVDAGRQMGRDEVERALSWALKTDNPHDVRVITTLTPAARASLPRSDDLSSLAWNEHLPRLVMLLLGRFGGQTTNDMPIRRPPSEYAFLDALMRLRATGLITGTREGVWSNTALGSLTMETLAMVEMATDRSFSFYAANLLARVRTERDQNIKRTLIRMAAIENVGIVRFCAPDAPRREIPMRDVAEQCAGIGREQCWRGGLWTALGVYLAFVSNGDHQNARNVVTMGPLIVNREAGWKITTMVRLLEEILNMPKEPNEVAGTSLKEDQVAAVEDHLVRVWFHRVITVPSNDWDQRISDAASQQLVDVNPAIELLDLEATKQRPQVRRARMFTAIYGSLERHAERIPTAADLTYVSHRSLDDLGTETGTTWKEAVRTHYPLH